MQSPLRRAPQSRRRPPAPAAALASGMLICALGCGDLKPTPTAPPLAPNEHVVTVASFSFTPATLTIRPGDHVIWRNAEGFHNVRADDGSFRCSEGCDGAGGNGDLSGSAWSFSRTFQAAGRVRYFCEAHGGPGGAGMSGAITIEAGS